MLRWRQATTPNIPDSLAALAEILTGGEWPRYTNCTNGQFFSGTVAVDGHVAVIFGNVDYIRNFVESQYTFMDGTFKVVPRRPRFLQILTIFATTMNHVSNNYLYYLVLILYSIL